AGAVHVIGRSRDTNSNLRTQMFRIIRKAGLEPWPKLFHNLRASRQTELAERYPIHVVCAWLGNSVAIAKEHYLQVTQDHYALAAAGPTSTSAKAAQKAAQSAAEPGCQELSGEPADAQETPFFQGYATAVIPGQSSLVAAAGLEPARGSPPKGF